MFYITMLKVTCDVFFYFFSKFKPTEQSNVKKTQLLFHINKMKQFFLNMFKIKIVLHNYYV